MSNTRRHSRRRANLMAEDPHCAYCGREVVYWRLAPGEKTPGNFATIEHVNTRNGGPRPLRGALLLACHDCNQAKGEQDRAEHEITAGLRSRSRHLTERIGDLCPQLLALKE